VSYRELYSSTLQPAPSAMAKAISKLKKKRGSSRTRTPEYRKARSALCAVRYNLNKIKDLTVGVMRKLIYSTLVPSYNLFHRKDHCLVTTLIHDLSLKIKKVSLINVNNRKVDREKRKAATLVATKPLKRKQSQSLIRLGRLGIKPLGMLSVRANNKKL
jgi:hypothetical protein